MEFYFTKQVTKKSPTIVEGFPGIGLVGTIATEFLIEHLHAHPIGMVKGHEIPPMVALHGGKIVRPMGLFYAEKHNIVILHVISGVPGSEWEIADNLLDYSKKIKAKELISLESVGVAVAPETNRFSDFDDVNAFYFTNNLEAEKRFKSIGIARLNEGIVMGVTGALMLNDDTKVSAIFAETHSKLPDSKAAAKIIKVLNEYLNLKLDITPLLKSAEEFEQKLRELMSRSQEAQQLQEDKRVSYIG